MNSNTINTMKTDMITWKTLSSAFKKKEWATS